MKKAGKCPALLPRLEDTSFWERCRCRRGLFFFLFSLFAFGLVSGPVLAVLLQLFRSGTTVPMFFSGIPVSGGSFLSFFFTFLLNQLIFLSVSFLLGCTVFGVAAIPLLMVLKGMTVGLGAISFFVPDFFPGLGRSAISYIPAAAASALLLLLFSLRSLTFSDRLRRIGFSSSKEELDFRSYGKDYFVFLCLSVAASLLSGAMAVLGALVFP